MENNQADDQYLLQELKERAKELNCLYDVDEILSDQSLSLAEIFKQLVRIIPSGWQHSKFCQARIIYQGAKYQESDFSPSDISQSSEINLDAKTEGRVEVHYSEAIKKEAEIEANEGDYFLAKEYKLIATIADRISKTISHRNLEDIIKRQKSEENESKKNNWQVIIDLLERTDQSMLLHIARKMLNYLSSRGAKEAEKVLWDFDEQGLLSNSEVNYPTEKFLLDDLSNIRAKTFKIATKHLTDEEIFIKINKWIQAEKAYSLIRTIDRIDTTVRDVIDAVTRYRNITGENSLLHSPTEKWLVVALIRIFCSDDLEFIARLKDKLVINDFYEIIDKIIFPKGSQGKIGGKATGLFAAEKALEKASQQKPELKSVKVPKTWYITTDQIKEFLHYNNLEELNVQKYKELFEIRTDYPNIIQLMKNSEFSDDLIKSLAMALDDFGDTPLIVRSSSLLEDRIEASFSGKYKSLFLANQGSKEERLEALVDAIVEVYASMYSPDSIQYRREAGLIDFPEEMGIMLQEVVGQQVGDYFFPLFAGVAFSKNEFLWSPRLKREDGLARMVMGLGTRAVDRVGDDFPVLLAPGQAGLKVNSTPEEVNRYSPKKLDVINLKQGAFETVEIDSFLKEYGHKINNLEQIVSIMKNNYLQQANAFSIDFDNDELVVTFDKLIEQTSFIKTMDTALKTLEEELETAVDVEFASDGENFYLLQCRPQSVASEKIAPPLPKNLAENELIFSAERYISNGVISDISHIVYVDPDAYSRLEEYDEIVDVGKAVGRLNEKLPKKRFILMGPGRWGSRGEVKMGVQVSYADINNTAMLIEIAKQKSDYTPELSFGSHFFLDLVEANIRYLPLYPDTEGIIFREDFLQESENILAQILPEYSHLEQVINVIDVPKKTDGKVFTIAMNGEEEQAIGYLTQPKSEEFKQGEKFKKQEKLITEQDSKSDDSHWRWRYHMAESLAESLDFSELGIKGIYIFGSTNSGTAGPSSDIDLLIHFVGDQKQRQRLMNILTGWSQSLAEMNYMKTGYRCDGLLDIRLVSDKDLAKEDIFASEIGDAKASAQPLKVKTELDTE